jgi:GABA(A) receptor-associated protein
MFYSKNNNQYTDNFNYSKFRFRYSFENRLRESFRIRQKYPDRIPVICEKSIGTDVPEINKNKYLVPNDLQVYNFMLVIRNRLRLHPSETLFLSVDGNIPSSTTTFSDLYYHYKNPDGYLYITYSKENVFG